GVMFAFEILLTGVVFTDFIPLVVAAVCGSLLSKMILNEDVLFNFKTGLQFSSSELPYFIVLGILCGLYARYFLAVAHAVEKYFKSWQASKMRKAIFGGIALSLICVLLPPLFGEGYQTIKELTLGKTDLVIQNSFFRYFPYQSWMILVFLGLICAVKAFATSITIQSGGNGGNFAPSLFAGGTFGFLFATACIQFGFRDVPVANLVLVGMAGVISGVLYAPLTAIFLIAESSAGYDLFIPLMIVSVISYLITISFSRLSPDLKDLAEEGKIFTREHDKNLLLLLDPAELIDEDTQTMDVEESMEGLLDLIKNGRRNIIAVVNGEGGLEGIITLDDLRPFMFQEEAYRSLTVRNIIKAPPAIITPDDSVVQIIRKFDESNSWNLPVVGSGGRFTGFISKSTVLNRYRKLLRDLQ
ncbi:MAG TPA: chloride channel protein, partial [Sphingobacteriaceae bacterium]